MNRLPVSLARACALWCAVSLTGVSVFAQEPAPPARPPRRQRRPTTSTRSWRRCSPGATSIAGRSTSTSSTRPNRSKSSVRAAGRCIAPGATSRGTSATACTSAARCGSTASRSATRRATSTRRTGFSASAGVRNARPRRNEKEKDEREGVGRNRDHRRGRADLHRRARGHRAALRVGSLLHGLQVRAGQLLPGRPGTARRPAGAEGRVLPDQDVRRLRRRQRTSGEQKEKSAEKPAADSAREPEATGEGEGVRAGHRAADEQDGADHALDRSARAPDRQVHVRQRLAGLPARRAGW